MASLGRALRLRCPDCGKGSIFRAPFCQNEACAECRTSFNPEPGFYLGAMQINIVINEFMVTILFFTLYLSTEIPWGVLVALTAALAVVMPVLSYHHSRSLWLTASRFLDTTD